MNARLEEEILADQGIDGTSLAKVEGLDDI
jgi:hypothetical protein